MVRNPLADPTDNRFSLVAGATILDKSPPRAFTPITRIMMGRAFLRSR